MENARWYVVNSYATYEKKVAELIFEQSEKKGLRDHFLEVLVPSEEVVEIKRGEKKTVERNFFPGYVLVKMVLNDDTWHMVRGINRVSGFVGTNNKPTPISEAEVKRILNQVKESVDKPNNTIAFEVGDQIRVVDGPFSSFNGYVEEVDAEKSRLKVSVTIFGRDTPVDLEYSQVEKT